MTLEGFKALGSLVDVGHQLAICARDSYGILARISAIAIEWIRKHQSLLYWVGESRANRIYQTSHLLGFSSAAPTLFSNGIEWIQQYQARKERTQSDRDRILGHIVDLAHFCFRSLQQSSELMNFFKNARADQPFSAFSMGSGMDLSFLGDMGTALTGIYQAVEERNHTESVKGPTSYNTSKFLHSVSLIAQAVLTAYPAVGTSIGLPKEAHLVVRTATLAFALARNILREIDASSKQNPSVITQESRLSVSDPDEETYPPRKQSISADSVGEGWDATSVGSAGTDQTDEASDNKETQ